MMKNSYFAKSIADVSWNHFSQSLTYKAEEAGRKLGIVNPAYTSQTCNQCGNREEKTLSERIHKHSVDLNKNEKFKNLDYSQKEIFSDEVAYRNILRTIKLIRERSQILNKLEKEGKIAIVGAMCDISSAEVSFFQPQNASVV